MTKYIVYGQKFPDDEDNDLGLRFRIEKIKECDNEKDAYDTLANVRARSYYEYEWIEEIEVKK